MNHTFVGVENVDSVLPYRAKIDHHLMKCIVAIISKLHAFTRDTRDIRDSFLGYVYHFVYPLPAGRMQTREGEGRRCLAELEGDD
jgi:hypothetical protein